MQQNPIDAVRPMPDRTPCVLCRKVGFIRFERVIRAGRSERHFYCGACTHAWIVADDGDSTAKHEPGAIPPDRSRPTRVARQS
jgi:hypothetical protein